VSRFPGSWVSESGHRFTVQHVWVHVFTWGAFRMPALFVLEWRTVQLAFRVSGISSVVAGGSMSGGASKPIGCNTHRFYLRFRH
jgi:hypothetical protein